MPRVYSKYASGQLIVYPGNTGPGEEYFVDSTNGSASNSGKDWENAMLTIDQGINKCTASNGDTVYVAPFHAENLGADSAIDINLAGVQVIGIRRGREMPTLTCTAAAGDCKLAAANTSIRNLRFLGWTGGAITGCIEVSAADCSIIDCEYRDVTDQAVDVIITTNAAKRLLIDGFRTLGDLAAGCNSHIAIVGAVDGVEIKNVWLQGNFAVGAIDIRTAACTNLWIHDFHITTANAADICIIDTITGSTGHIGPNGYLETADDAETITEAITGATFSLFDPIYVNNAVAEKAMLIDWTVATQS